MTPAEPGPEPPTLGQLGRQLLPLSLSDAAMAVADPLLAMTLTRLPAATLNLAALGVVKAIAVFLESPIIMVLHASTALCRKKASREAFRRFVTALASVLTMLFLMLLVPPVYQALMSQAFSLEPEVVKVARLPLLIMVGWPAIIAWRRIHQGHLICQGRGKAMGLASLCRVGTFAGVLGLGMWSGLDGATLGATAFMVGLVVEATLVFRWSREEAIPESATEQQLPTDVPAVSRYYAPLALTMILMWGGRAALVAILARAVDASLALAAWAASWGFVILVSNLTRMVQQLVIKYADQVPVRRLVALGFWVGALCTVLLTGLGYTPWGYALLTLLIGTDPQILAAAQAVVRLSLLLPLLTSLQNVFQGYCISAGRNMWVNVAGLLGVGVTLILAYLGVDADLPGASVGAVAVAVGLAAEVLTLGVLRPWKAGT